MTGFVSSIQTWPQALVATVLVLAFALVVAVVVRAFFVGR